MNRQEGVVALRPFAATVPADRLGGACDAAVAAVYRPIGGNIGQAQQISVYRVSSVRVPDDPEKGNAGPPGNAQQKR